MNYNDIDFIEIGTSNFRTIIENCDDNTKGISVEPISYYLNQLPNKKNVIKANFAITKNKKDDYSDFYYIPEEIIIKNNLPNWFKGCNTINDYHPLHIKHNVINLVNIEKVKVLNIEELLEKYNVRKINFLKIDTEGHDVVILDGLYDYLLDKSLDFYPKKIQFESNEHTDYKLVTDIIEKYVKIGYKLIVRGYDSILEI
jgi:FkbM family methyltransferase